MSGLATAVVGLDRSAFHAINGSMASPFLDAVMPGITRLGLGHWQVLTVLALAAALGVRRSGLPGAVPGILQRKAWVGPLILAFCLSGLAAQAGKGLISRARPYWFYANEQKAGRFQGVIVRTVSGERPLRVHGFPSGHTCTSVALALTATLIWRRRRDRRPWLVGAWLMATLIGLSRIYVGDHWPLDVAGGAALGAAMAPAALALAHRFHWIQPTPVAPGDA